jgi:EF hand
MTMKTLLLSATLFALATPALAQQSPVPSQAPMPPQGQRPSPFERADANRDGVITRDEVRASRTAAFTRLDTNRDGFLVQTEMHAGRSQMENGPGRAGQPMGGHGGDLLARADINGDGNVTRAEFDAAWANAQAAKAERRAQSRQFMFNRLDANKDGTITRAEAEAARGQMPPRPPQDPEGMGPQGDAAGSSPRGEARRPNPDTNNDQKISLAEWLARPDPLFDRGDANKDGRVTREEAAAIVRQGRGQPGRPGRPW